MVMGKEDTNESHVVFTTDTGGGEGGGMDDGKSLA